MTSVRGMLQRVARLEAARAAPKSPIEIAYGSMDAFAEQVEAEIGEGVLDNVDMPVVLAALRRWHDDAVWAGWSRNRNRV
ncbi:hypothetical protein [Albidovulum sp.]|uniref:hypothetical protein n=1 Tax=Albidovulum sp. TaxID=1872424 RepID=UPI0039B97E5B